MLNLSDFCKKRETRPSVFFRAKTKTHPSSLRHRQWRIDLFFTEQGDGIVPNSATSIIIMLLDDQLETITFVLLWNSLLALRTKIWAPSRLARLLTSARRRPSTTE